MGNISRRDFLAMAAVLGAEAAWGRSSSTPSKISWRERRDIFPEGVASGDPDSNSVLLWTRRAPLSEPQSKPAHELGAELTVEVALDQAFQRVIATKKVSITAEADWTCRVLVGGLKPAQLCSAPGRLHLRAGLVSGGPRHLLRPQGQGTRSLCSRRENSGLPHPSQRG
jgi:alkaline phosphatase D